MPINVGGSKKWGFEYEYTIKGILPLDQQQVLVGQIELVGAVSVVAAAAAAAAVVVEVEIFEVAAQTPAAEVL